jgi:hypothetical protein
MAHIDQGDRYRIEQAIIHLGAADGSVKARTTERMA